MNHLQNLVALVLCGLSLVTTIGCGSGSTPITSENPEDGIVLTEVGEAYRSYQLLKGRPPNSAKEATTMERNSPRGVVAIKDGNVIVNWGAKLPDTGEEPSGVSAPEILAYQKKVPEQGGYVLLLDRSIKKMTADEFKAAKPAGKN